MNWLTANISDGVIHALGMTFLHSIWLGVLAAFFVSISFHVFKEKRADIRYNISAIAMAVFFLAVCSVFTIYYEDTSDDALPSVELGDRLSETDLVSDSAMATETDLFGQVQSFLNQHAEALVLFWLIGIMLLSIRFAGGFLYIRRLRTIGLSPVPDEWQSKMEAWGLKLGLDKLPSFHMSSLVTSPIAFGYIKPVILFPLGMFTSMPVQHLDAMLMHELMHVKNADYITNLFLSVVEILLFFNPAVWWLSGVIRAEMEHRCDDMAVAMTGNKMSYAYALVAMQENKIYHKTELALGMARNSSQLTQRVNRLFGLQEGRSTSYGRPVISLIVLLSSVMLLAFSSPDDENEEPKTELDTVDSTYSSLFPNKMSNLTFAIDSSQFSGTLRVLLINGKEEPISKLYGLVNEEVVSMVVYTDDESESLDFKYEGEPILVVKTRKIPGPYAAGYSFPDNNSYYFNDEEVDKDVFYQVSKDSVGVSHGLVRLEGRAELRFYTDMQLYESWKKKTEPELEKRTKNTPPNEKILIVDGEIMPIEYLETLQEEENIGPFSVTTKTDKGKFIGPTEIRVTTKKGSSSNLIENEKVGKVAGDSLGYEWLLNANTSKEDSLRIRYQAIAQSMANKSQEIKNNAVKHEETPNYYISSKLRSIPNKQKINHNSHKLEASDLTKKNKIGDSTKQAMSKYYMLVAQSMANRQKANFGYDPRTRVAYGPSLTMSIQDSTELTNRIKEKPGLTLMNNPVHGFNQSGRTAFDTIRGVGYIPGVRIAFSTSLTKSIDQDSIPPLILVDGVKEKGISTLDPNDIASISVLKDRSTTEVYGKEGANGVILITTKKNRDRRHTEDTKLSINHTITKRSGEYYLKGIVTGNITKQNVTDAFIRFDDNWEETFHTDKNGKFEIMIPSRAKEAVIRHFMLPSVYISVDPNALLQDELQSAMEKSLKIYSNPVSDIVNIELYNDKDQWVFVNVISIDTKKVVKNLQRKKLRKGHHSFEWNSKKANPGIYSIWVQADGGAFSRKVVVEH